MTQHLWLLYKELQEKFLYQLVGYWFVSSVPGVMDEEEGCLKSNISVSTPPDMEWKWCKRGILFELAFEIKLQETNNVKFVGIGPSGVCALQLGVAAERSVHYF